MSTTRTARGLAELEVRDAAGRRVRLGDAWRERPAVLALVRHFG